MKETIIYNDDVIEVCIIPDSVNEDLNSIAIRYLEPRNYHRKDGQEIQVTNSMEGETI